MTRITMNKPDAKKHNPNPDYIRGLIESAGLSQRKAADLIGVNERTMRRYCSESAKPGDLCPYPVQYCLEALAMAPSNQEPIQLATN